MLDYNPLYIFVGNAAADHCEHLEAVHLNIDQTLAILKMQTSDLDLCELRGGEARVSKLAIRRGIKTDKNFDIVCSMTQIRKVH